jgi:hypothetical protein
MDPAALDAAGSLHICAIAARGFATLGILSVMVRLARRRTTALDG